MEAAKYKIMQETTINIKIGDGRISGVLHSPDNIRSDKTVLVFLHGWAGYKIGPHQMFVKLSRILAAKGYYCMRFDFRGRGYSTGDQYNTTNKTMLADLEAIISYLKETLQYNRIILLGICSGAKIAIYNSIHGKDPINGVIELSSSLLRNDTESLKNINKKRYRLQKYLSTEKLFRLLKGKVLAKNIVEIATHNLRNSIWAIKGYLSNGKNDIRTLTSNDVGKSIQLPEAPFLLIHGENDPEAEVSIRQIVQLIGNYGLRHEQHTIKGANHSFYSSEWENRIFNIIEKWLATHFQPNTQTEGTK